MPDARARSWRPLLVIVACVLVIGVMIGIDRLKPDILTQVGAPLQGVTEVLNPRITRHVIIISIDGLRPDAIAKFDAPTLQWLVKNGRSTLNARTIKPAKTLPSHASMLTGVPPSVHGITWNADSTATRGRIKVPTIFEIARRRGLRTAAFFGKTKFEHLAVEGSFDYIERPIGGLLSRWASQIDKATADYLHEASPNLLFVHIADVDFAGHRVGWMSWYYGRAVSSADAAVRDIMNSADGAFGKGEYTLIVTSDHGGTGTDHGYHAQDEIIPWMVWGEGVNGSGPITDPVSTMDTAATALWLLGIDPPSYMTGKPVLSAFRHVAPLISP